MDERQRLLAEMDDPELGAYFWLDRDADAALDSFDSLGLSLDARQDDVPFNAAVKGYLGATDSGGHPWIVKPADAREEVLYHRLCTLAFLLDHLMGTLAAPTGLVRIGDRNYRVTKVVRRAVQISSYDYLGPPYIGVLRADLVNRWLMFDEDRNPNNYLVVFSRHNKPFVVAIDYDKADLAATAMKITGNPDHFGWHRAEKTRFLTLLRPEHFDGVPLEVFDARLKAMMAIPEGSLRSLVGRLLSGYAEPEYADRIAQNILERREYIDRYFRSMFKPQSETIDTSHTDDYSAFGESFVNMHKGRT